MVFAVVVVGVSSGGEYSRHDSRMVVREGGSGSGSVSGSGMDWPVGMRSKRRGSRIG